MTVERKVCPICGHKTLKVWWQPLGAYEIDQRDCRYKGCSQYYVTLSAGIKRYPEKKNDLGQQAVS